MAWRQCLSHPTSSLSPPNRTCWSHLSLRASSSCFLRASTSSIFLAVAFFLAFSASRSSLACRIHSHVPSEAASHTAWSLCDRHPHFPTNPSQNSGERHKKPYHLGTAHSPRVAGKKRIRLDFLHSTCLRKDQSPRDRQQEYTSHPANDLWRSPVSPFRLPSLKC